MNALKKFARRALATLGVAALGVVGVSAGASADELDTGNINPDAVGSIIIHKHEDDGNTVPGSPTGRGLDGVTFRVTEILHNGASVPLETMEGWQAIDTLSADVIAAPFSRGDHVDVVTGVDGSATASNLGVGVYLVEEIDSGENLVMTPAAPFIVTIPFPTPNGWDYNVDVYPKNDLGDVVPTKTVGTPDSPADLVVGAIVPFTISVPVANPGLPYVSFSIEDALSPGLEFSSWGAISVGGEALLPADYSVSADSATITFTTTGLEKLNTAAEGSPTGTTVTAVINAEVTDLGKLDNVADVTINGTTGTTPPVTTNWAKLILTKTGVDDATLAGAEFELYAANQETLLATGTTGADGTVSFVVWVGNNSDVTETVYVKETVAPEGYVLPADPWFGPYTLTAGDTAEASVLTGTISNYKPEGPDLPMTGAQGTMLLTLGGLLLVGTGGGALALSRRRSEA